MTEALSLFSELWHHHRHVLYLVAGWYIFNCAVQGMPKPNGVTGQLYSWVYGTLHGICGNWRLIVKVLQQRKLPALEPEEQPFAVGFECTACGVVMAETVILKAGAPMWTRVKTKCSECAVKPGAVNSVETVS